MMFPRAFNDVFKRKISYYEENFNDVIFKLLLIEGEIITIIEFSSCQQFVIFKLPSLLSSL